MKSHNSAPSSSEDTSEDGADSYSTTSSEVDVPTQPVAPINVNFLLNQNTAPAATAEDQAHKAAQAEAASKDAKEDADDESENSSESDTDTETTATTPSARRTSAGRSLRAIFDKSLRAETPPKVPSESPQVELGTPGASEMPQEHPDAPESITPSEAPVTTVEETPVDVEDAPPESMLTSVGALAAARLEGLARPVAETTAEEPTSNQFDTPPPPPDTHTESSIAVPLAATEREVETHSQQESFDDVENNNVPSEPIETPPPNRPQFSRSGSGSGGGRSGGTGGSGPTGPGGGAPQSFNLNAMPIPTTNPYTYDTIPYAQAANSINEANQVVQRYNGLNGPLAAFLTANYLSKRRDNKINKRVSKLSGELEDTNTQVELERRRTQRAEMLATTTQQHQQRRLAAIERSMAMARPDSAPKDTLQEQNEQKVKPPKIEQSLRKIDLPVAPVAAESVPITPLKKVETDYQNQRQVTNEVTSSRPDHKAEIPEQPEQPRLRDETRDNRNEARDDPRSLGGLPIVLADAPQQPRSTPPPPNDTYLDPAPQLQPSIAQITQSTQVPDRDQPQSDLYKQAVQKGFMVGIAVVVIGVIAYVVL